MTDENRPLKVFLCHASVDKPQVLELYRRLKAEPWIDPWLDKAKLLPGQHWSTVIKETLAEADSVIIFISNASVSHEGFSQRELNLAWDYSLEKPRSVIYLIPLRLEDCEVPYDLRERHWANYFGDEKDETYIALLRALKVRHEQKLKLEAEESARQEKIKKQEHEKVELRSAEKTARENTEQEAIVQAAQKKAEHDTAEKAADEKTEREASEKRAHEEATSEKEGREVTEKIEQEIIEKSARAKAERESIKRAEPEKAEQTAAKKTQNTNRKSGAPYWGIALLMIIGIICVFAVGVYTLTNLFTPNFAHSPTATILVASITQPSTNAFTPLPASKTPVPSATLKKELTSTSIATATISPSQQSDSTNVVADLPNNNLLYFVTGDDLNVIDTLSGKVQKLSATKYGTYIEVPYGYSTISWLNDYQIAIYSVNSLQIFDLKSDETKNVTIENKIDGLRVSDISNTGKVFYQATLAMSPVLLVQTIDNDGTLTSPIDIGFNMQKYSSPFCMRWSPDNSQLALNISDKTGAIANIPGLAILRYGQGEEPIIIQRNVDGCISWPPDSKYIVFGNGKPRNLFAFNHKDIKLTQGIYFIEIKSKVVTKLTDTSGYYPVWSSDGKTIAFLTEQGISLVDVDTKDEKQIYQGDVSALLWGK